MWRLFYDVEACYDVDIFLRCRDFRCKELLMGFDFISQIGEYVKSPMSYPFGHRAMQSVID